MSVSSAGALEEEDLERRSLRDKVGNLKGVHRKAAVTNPEEHRVTELPGLSPVDAKGLSQYAGLLQIDAVKDSNIFYWLVEKQNDAINAPLVIWLNGGPGCSSMDGMWLENGPFRLDGSKLDQVKLNPYSWHQVGNMLYVDQPVGTGFSYTSRRDGYASNDAAINESFYTFLVRKSRPIFFTGESHAGHYIPTIVAHILEMNKASPSILLDVAALALGNPWLDPPTQYDASDMAHGLGLITQGQLNNLKAMHKKCQSLLKTGRLRQNVCFELLDLIIDSTAAAGGEKLLMYDARKFVARPSSFPPGHEALERYMNTAAVKSALHVSQVPQKFEECTDPPYNALAHQDGLSAVPQLVKVLNEGIRVLVFSGNFDLVCNHLSTESVLMDMQWTGSEGWRMAKSGVWVVDKSPAGYIKQFNNLQSLVVMDSGHMVPLDQPKRALDMFDKFIHDKPFSVGTTKLQVSASPQSDCPPQQRRTSVFSESFSGSEQVTDTSTLSSVAEQFGYGKTALMSSFITVGVLVLLVLGHFCCRPSSQKRNPSPGSR
eukprot:GSChrysophyteH1.ASY1.ANO1.515.1 assembled CDS